MESLTKHVFEGDLNDGGVGGRASHHAPDDGLATGQVMAVVGVNQHGERECSGSMWDDWRGATLGLLHRKTC